jgi:transcriptional regulator with XRE-family HTH domain
VTADEHAVIAEVGARLHAERKRQRYSQEAIGAMIGMSQQALSQMELGQQIISLPIYLSWCDALGVEPWELLGWRESVGQDDVRRFG